MPTNEQFHLTGLKCDNPLCDYADPSIPHSAYKDHIDAPCPDCGQPLLTQADYDLVQHMMSIANLLGIPVTDTPGDGEPTLSFNLNGTGVIEQMQFNLPSEPETEA